MSFVRLVMLNDLFCWRLTSKTLSLELISRFVDEFLTNLLTQTLEMKRPLNESVSESK